MMYNVKLLRSLTPRCNEFRGDCTPVSLVHGQATRDFTLKAAVVTRIQYAGPEPSLLSACVAQAHTTNRKNLVITHYSRRRAAMRASASQRPVDQGKGQPQPAVFQPCLKCVSEGKINCALDMLRQLIAEHGPPERADGDAILLVRPFPSELRPGKLVLLLSLDCPHTVFDCSAVQCSTQTLDSSCQGFWKWATYQHPVCPLSCPHRHCCEQLPESGCRPLRIGHCCARWGRSRRISPSLSPDPAL